MASSAEVGVMFLLMFTLIMINAKADRNRSTSTSNVISLGSSLSPSVHNLTTSSWLSSSGRFAFGFYPQGNGFAVGIQLLNRPPLQNTVVWTANRDHPPFSSNSSLILTSGGLLLRTEGGQEILTTYGPSSLETTSSSSSSTTAAAMLDSGNFVLYDETRRASVIWESFGFPTDTILGGQDLERGMGLVSSASVSDHSSGLFSLNMQTGGNLVAYPPNSTHAYWKIDAAQQLRLNLSGFLVVGRAFSDVFFSIDPIRVVANGSYHRPQDNQTTVLYRATLDVDGNFRLYSHDFLMNGSAAGPMVIWAALQNPCDAKGICGFNSYCQVAKASQDVECKCYPGFVYNNVGDKSLGCYLNFTQNGCTGNEESRLQYKLEALNNMWWQNDPYSVTHLNKEDCGNSCLEDCNCWTVLYTDAECRKYKLPLLYGKRRSNISSRGFIKVLLPINMDAMPNHNPHPTKNLAVTLENKNNSLILILAISLGSIAFLCFVFAISSFTIYIHRIHRYKLLLKHSNLALADQEYFTLKSFSYSELERATDGFKEEIGRGTFGAVYKGTLSGSGNKIVAVKRLEKVVEEGVREFKAEITTIGRTHHRNLVQLLGFCIEGSRKLLVYEYMSNGSLADLLFKAKGVHPSWKERVGLVFDVAKGILYLHDECSVHIIHSNLKPQNILLDNTRTAKISDFGLARLVPNETKINSTQGGGVQQVRSGYLAPEWQKNALISVKADIYSFGIVLLEIVCGRRNIEANVSTPDEIVLLSWVSKCFAAGDMGKLVEDDENVDLKTLERMVKVGLWCVQDDPALRPFMKNVILMLEGTMDIAVPPCPELPSLG